MIHIWNLCDLDEMFWNVSFFLLQKTLYQNSRLKCTDGVFFTKTKYVYAALGKCVYSQIPTLKLRTLGKNNQTTCEWVEWEKSRFGRPGGGLWSHGLHCQRFHEEIQAVTKYRGGESRWSLPKKNSAGQGLRRLPSLYPRLPRTAERLDGTGISRFSTLAFSFFLDCGHRGDAECDPAI